MSQPPQNRAEQKKLTRQRLLNATIDIISREGLSGVTLGKVAEKTELSRGICNYHFNTKEQLMLETLRMLYQEHEQVWRAAVATPGASSAGRMAMLVRALLTPPIAEHRKLSVWMAFWGVAPQRETYLEICANIDREYEAEVEKLLQDLSGGVKVINSMPLNAIAVALTSMIDGFWVNYLISPGCLTPEDAIKACLAFLSGFFPQIEEFTCTG